MEELLSRQLPHSLQAEQAVLGSMLIDSRCIAEDIGMLKPDAFFLGQDRAIYETIYPMVDGCGSTVWVTTARPTT